MQRPSVRNVYGNPIAQPIHSRITNAKIRYTHIIVCMCVCIVWNRTLMVDLSHCPSTNKSMVTLYGYSFLSFGYYNNDYDSIHHTSETN